MNTPVPTDKRKVRQFDDRAPEPDDEPPLTVEEIRRQLGWDLERCNDDVDPE
jgi:hypothetical protein